MFQRSELGSFEEPHIDHFDTFLQALPQEDDAALRNFFSFNGSKNLSRPWKSGQETLSFFLALRKVVQELNITAGDMVARSNILHFSCLVEGVSRKKGGAVAWPFSGRVRFAGDKIAAGILYADFFALFRQLGNFSVPPDDDPFLEHSVEHPVGRFGLEVRYTNSPSLSCDRTGRIQNVSASFLRLIGKSTEEVVGGTLQDNAHFEDEMKVKGLLRASFREMQKEVRLRLNHKAGGVVWVVGSVVNTAQDTLVLGFQEDTRVGELIRFQLEERAKLSRDLHDGLSQDAAALWLLLEADEKNWDPMLGQALVERMLVELGALIADLKSPIYEGKSLRTSLQDLKARFESEAGLSVNLQVDERFGPDLVLDVVVYRIVQEALSNVKKHAHTKRASVSIDYCGNRLVGSIKDNGRGFDVSVLESTDRLGIKGMRERCHLYGGRLSVNSRPLGGTTVSFELPLKTGVVLG